VSPRRAGSARIYGERERVRIKLILRGKRLGLSLAEIGELLDLYEVGRNERAQLSKFLEMLGERRERLLQQKEDIDDTLAEIEGLERECRRRLGEPDARAPPASVPSGAS
jgi:DNA-binding transcriptional MerR regulator